MKPRAVYLLAVRSRMNSQIASNSAAISPQHPGGTTPPDNQREEKTAQGISVVPPEQVSPLLVLPNELLFEIANYLPFNDFNRLALTNRRLATVFNTEERLKKLADEYYGSASDDYRKIIQNRAIPAVPNHKIRDRLLELAYLRYTSNKYLASQGSDAGQQTCVASLNGHIDEVKSVTPLADGRLASCSDDRTIKIWDLSIPDGQQCVATLKGHTWVVKSVTQLPDGKLATASEDKTIKVWDLNKLDEEPCVATLNGHTKPVLSVTALADGRLASCSSDSTIKLWDLSKLDRQQCVATLHGHTKGVGSVTQLPDGRLASGSGDNTIKVWDLSKLDEEPCVATLNGHTRWVVSVTALADGRLASCSLDKTIKVWDLSKPNGHQCVVTLHGHTNWVRSVTVLADGRLASCAGDYHDDLLGDGSGDKSIKVWDLSMPDGQQCVATLSGHTFWVNSVTQLADGRLASCSYDETVKVWDLSKPCVSTLNGILTG